ncbi:MAG: YkgJ family cysteine cluster protein [Planctomycetes bacterium]|nr:YkgJ family cysteine cluster protein [Planctomycetota bacterium]
MTDQTHPLIRQLESVCARADAEFERGRRVHGARILCAAGCSSCCSQIFQITEVEAARIAAHVAQLPQAARDLLQARARENLRKRDWLFSGNEQWGDSLGGGGNPCPALTPEGACGMYEARPIMCRKFGVPIFNPDKPQNVMACELNFKPGEAIEDAQLVSNQTALYRAQQQLQADWNDAGGGRDDRPWCIARAIVEDARKFLP